MPSPARSSSPPEILADPALLGVSGGAALGAAAVLSLGTGALAASLTVVPVAGAAFFLAVALVLRLGQRGTSWTFPASSSPASPSTRYVARGLAY